MGLSAHDMIGRLRYNKSLQHKKRAFKKDKSFKRLKGEFEAKAQKDHIQLKTATKEQLADIRERILKDRKAEKMMQIAVILIVTPLLIFGANAYFNTFNPTSAKDAQYSKAATEAKSERQAQYTYFINSGDQWINENNWYNAIFEYKKALELVPTDFAAKYRLALAYTYSCQTDGEHCDEAAKSIHELMKQDLNNPDVYSLRASYFQAIGDSAHARLDHEKTWALKDAQEGR